MKTQKASFRAMPDETKEDGMEKKTTLDDQPYALVTGASRGLGKAFAKELSQLGYNLILVSLPNEGLPQLARTLEEDHGIRVRYFEKDLTQKENIVEIAAEVNNNYTLEILVNNAGFGGGRYFAEVGERFLDGMILLNVRATVLLTHKVLPNLQQRKRAFVLNVSSLAAKCPIPFKTVYPSTKAFIYSFSRSMQKEYADTSVHFGVVCPGPMMTNPDVVKRMEHQGFIVRQSILTPEKVAHLSLQQLFEGKALIPLTWYHRLQWFMLKLVPESLKMRILGKIAKNEVISTEKPFTNPGYGGQWAAGNTYHKDLP